MILRVFPAHVAGLWPQVSPLFTRILAARGTHDDEDVRRACMGGAADLWMQWNEPTVEAALVSEFAVYPRGIWVRIWLDGALPTVRQDHEAFFVELDRWRRANKCRGFEVVGRSGWARLFPLAKVDGAVMRWTMED